jgi:hypothetical protein
LLRKKNFAIPITSLEMPNAFSRWIMQYLKMGHETTSWFVINLPMANCNFQLQQKNPKKPLSLVPHHQATHF